MGLGGGTGNVPFASSASRDAYQAAHRACAANDRLSRNVSSPSRRRARSPSEDSDSDDQSLSQRRRRRAPRTMPDSGPSSIPSPPHAAVFTPSPQVTPPPIPSHAVDPPTSSSNQAEPPLAHPSTSQHPHGYATSKHAHDDEAGPSERPSTVSTVVPPQGPSSAPSSTTTEPSAPPGSAAGPSGPPPLIYQNYCITLLSEEQLWSQTDVPTSSLKIKGRLATIWEESLRYMDSLPPPTQMDRFAELYIKILLNKMLRDRVAELELQLNDPAQASHALRAEIKTLTSRKNSLEVSPALTNHELEEL
ncbi:putative uncharacterized protein DDB_G0290521 [Zingiber officinale]|uniref:putative uncharacterized protein DDB_G0290521 n=1 Tax=Zingiber officinale TaxID=94328 RepID=UPI001C4CCFA8|nr:putative uncharacterized protein DDB_G0290521 [Zingiber officinale]